jgi:uncharacterized protein
MRVWTASQREPWVDALRALAVLGVFVVNAMGYPVAPNYPVYAGAPNPADSTIAQLTHAFLIAFVQGKAWPLLCFLFGYSLCTVALQSRAKGWAVRQVLRTRYRKLLLVGIVHGTLVYFGDVLTAYAVCGLICGRWALVRPARLLKIWQRFTVLFICLAVLYVALGVVLFLSPSTGDALEKSGQAAVRLFTAPDVPTLWLLNASTYLSHSVDALFFLPVLLWLTVAGMLARRFSLLSTRRYAQLFWSKHIHPWQLYAALVLNTAIAVAVTQLQSLGGLYEMKLQGISTWASFAGIWLAVALVATGMRRWHTLCALPRWAVWLAPAGRHTLLMYLSLSVILMLTNGACLGLAGHTALRLGVVVVAWVAAIFIARYATARGMRDPIARWLSAGAGPKTL